jgi:sugar lactone lactonase YvrE
VHAEVVDPAPAGLGEGPAWDAAGQRLLWVDVFAGHLHVAGADGGRRYTYTIGRHLSAALPAAGPGVLIVAREGFAVLDAVTAGPAVRDAVSTQRPVLDVLGGDQTLRFNDAKCDPAGRAVAGTMAYDSSPGAGALYRLTDGPAVTLLRSKVTVSNGLGWNPAGDRLYHADSPTGRVTTYAYRTDGPLGAPLAALEIPPAHGYPDGLCTDDDGGLWVALWDGGQVRRYTPDGRLDTVVQLPIQRPTSCCFAGDTLFITSAYRGLTDPAPHSGCLFAVRPGITGPAATPWRPITGLPAPVLALRS